MDVMAVEIQHHIPNSKKNEEECSTRESLIFCISTYCFMEWSAMQNNKMVTLKLQNSKHMNVSGLSQVFGRLPNVSGLKRGEGSK